MLAATFQMSEISDNSMDDIMLNNIVNDTNLLKSENIDEHSANCAIESQQVITDKQEYYEIMLVDGNEDLMKIGQKIPIKLINSSRDSDAVAVSSMEGNKLHIESITSRPNMTHYPASAARVMKAWRRTPDPVKSTEPVKILPKPITNGSAPPGKVLKGKRVGRRKAEPPPIRSEPVKILPKLTTSFDHLINDGTNGSARLVRLMDNPKPESARSEQIDKLIEKMLKENTNEIDVFFRSMAASVKKLQPNLIPKVKMEVCNVIAKYEMQSFEHNK